MQEVRHPEKEREASGHAGNEELGLRLEQIEIGGCNEAGDCANRCAAGGVEEKALQAARAPARRSGFIRVDALLRFNARFLLRHRLKIECDRLLRGRGVP